MSSLLKPQIIQNKIITYFDDDVTQDTTTDTMLPTLDKYQKILKTENLQSVSDESFFLL